MTTANINIVLTNAVCCISEKAEKVSKLLSLGDKCAESELVKLKLLNDYVEVLRCYNNDIVTSKFTIRLAYDDYVMYSTEVSNILKNYTLNVNDVTTTMPGDGVTTKVNLFLSLLNAALPNNGYYVLIDPSTRTNRFVYLYIEGLCNTEKIEYQVSTISTGALGLLTTFTRYEVGNCELQNCFSTENIDIIINKIMASCEICDCQLTQ